MVGETDSLGVGYSSMSFLLHKFAESVEALAAEDGLRVRAVRSGIDLSGRGTWPQDALDALGGWRTAIEIEQLLEVGLAELAGTDVGVPYANLREIDGQMPASLAQ